MVIQAKIMNKSTYDFIPKPPVPPIHTATEFDGKRLRKAIDRKTVDYNSSVARIINNRVWTKGYHHKRAIQPDIGYYPHLIPPLSMVDNPVNCVNTKFVRTSTNKMRCPIFCVIWTPEGRRLITGASSGEFTLWNGLTFNFETILQAHDSAVRKMVWSRNETWMITADQGGYIKYWQSNMNNVKMFHAHDDPIRGLSMCPTDTKFASCSDDGSIKIWDFFQCIEEQVLRGHGAEVKGVDWHPTRSLLVSASKDSQQPIKLWDPKSGLNITTIHAHKSTVMDVRWNQNGNWLLTASRDHLIKIFDIRNISQEMQIFRGHKKEACCLAWHPIHESLFASGGSDGSILFWLVGNEKEVGGMDCAHDSVVWSINWHPLGHILASGSNDHTCKFWTRNRPGDKMEDKYNLNTSIMPKGQEEGEYVDIDDEMVVNKTIPGLGLPVESIGNNEIKVEEGGENQPNQQRKVPFSKPVPKVFENQWSDRKSHPVIAPNDIDRQFNSDYNMGSASGMGSGSMSNQSLPSDHGPPPPIPPPYLQGPPPPLPSPHQYAPPPHQYAAPPHQYAPPPHQYAPPPHQYAPPPHPIDGSMPVPTYMRPGPMHRPGPSGPPVRPPPLPPHMRRDDIQGPAEYHCRWRDEDFRISNYKFRGGPEWRRLPPGPPSSDDYHWNSPY